MKNIQKAIKRVHQIDALSKRTTILSAIHPTYKILIVLLYLIITASYSIHNIYIVVMFLSLLLFSMLGEINLYINDKNEIDFTQYPELNAENKDLYIICGTVMLIMFLLQPFTASLLWELIL